MNWSISSLQRLWVLLGCLAGVVWLHADTPLKHWHWRAPTPTGRYVFSIAYGNGSYVGVNEKEILLSTNAVDWQIVSEHVGLRFSAVVFGNGKFLISASDTNDDLMLTSTNGHNWMNTIGGGWGTIAYGSGKFVAVMPSGLSYSSDGITWTEAVNPATNAILKISYANDLFLAVGVNAEIMTSADGVNWIHRHSFTNYSTAAYAVAYGNGRYVVPLYNSNCLVSLDTITWTSHPSPLNGVLGLAFGNGVFLMGNDSGAISTNGIDWSLIDPEDGPYQMREVTFLNGQFFSTPTLERSTNGHNWQWLITSVEIPPLSRLIYGNNEFVAVGGDVGTPNTNHITVSSDGVTWRTFSLPQHVPQGRLTDIVWANGVYVAIGSRYPTNIHLLTSPDLRDWSVHRFTNYMDHPLTITYGNGKFVVTAGSTIVTSTDGTNWSNPRERALEMSFDQLVFGNGRFLGVGWEGFGTSENGVNWTYTWRWNSPEGYHRQFSRLAFGNGTFVAVGYDEWTYSAGMAPVAISTTGIDWTYLLVPTPPWSTLETVGFGRGLFVAAGWDAGVYYSANGTDWTWCSAENPSGGGGDVIYGNKTFVLFNGGTEWIRQSDPFIDLELARDGTLSISGASGRSYRIEGTSDLNTTNWQALARLTLTNELSTWKDNNSTNEPRRFYRVAVEE